MTNPPRNILITGAGSGLGRGLAICLAAEGHFIHVTDIDSESANETVRLVEIAAGKAEAHNLDVGSEQSVEQFFEKMKFRGIEVLVNNAGLQQVATIEEFPVDKWDLLMHVMLRGSFLMTRAALSGMRVRGFGRIIHIGSIHSVVASPFKSAYVAAKHALLGFSKTTALETADVDITSNAICPAYIRTPLVEAQIRDQALLRNIPEDEVIRTVMLEKMPKKTFITAEEVAGCIEFLISPMARNVTGQAIGIDGGWTAQ